MAIVSDYMLYGNCNKCGKYLAQGTFCCDGIVQSNYTVWLDNMMNKKKDENITSVVTAPRTGVKFIREVMEKHGEEHFSKVVKENNRVRETYSLAFAKDKNNPAYYLIILAELFNNDLVTLEQYETIVDKIREKFSNQEGKGNE